MSKVKKTRSSMQCCEQILQRQEDPGASPAAMSQSKNFRRREDPGASPAAMAQSKTFGDRMTPGASRPVT